VAVRGDELTSKRLVGLRGFHRVRPNNPARRAVEAKRVTHEPGDVARIVRRRAVAAVTGEEDACAADARTRRSRPRKRSPPDQVFLLAPFEGNRRVGSCAVAAIPLKWSEKENLIWR